MNQQQVKLFVAGVLVFAGGLIAGNKIFQAGYESVVAAVYSSTQNTYAVPSTRSAASTAQPLYPSSQIDGERENVGQYSFRIGPDFSAFHTTRTYADDVRFRGPIRASSAVVDVNAPGNGVSAELTLEIYKWSASGEVDRSASGKLFSGTKVVTATGPATFELKGIELPRRVFLVTKISRDTTNNSFWGVMFNPVGSPTTGFTEVGGWEGQAISSLSRYAYPRELSATVFGQLIATQGQCAGDANEDRMVNNADLSILNSQLKTAVFPHAGADFNGDGMVNEADLSILNQNMGTYCAN